MARVQSGLLRSTLSNGSLFPKGGQFAGILPKLEEAAHSGLF